VRKVLCTLLVSLALEVAQFAYGEEETTMMRNPEQTIGNLIDKRFFRGVQLLGTMEVCTDTATKEMIWRDGDTMYYSGGVTDADYCVLKFTACRGRYYSNFSSGDFEI
jgi:general stress protein 26